MKIRGSVNQALEPYPQLKNRLRVIKWNLSLLRYRLAGSPVPPPQAVKLFWLSYFQKKYSLQTFIETGTFFGTTIAALSEQFESLYSIELDPILYIKAVTRFQSYSHIQIYPGDSGKVLPMVLMKVHGPGLFWLDGHYSGGVTSKGEKATPISEEIRAICAHQRKDHVILIDDARLFNGEDQYPTVENVFEQLKKINSDYRLDIKDDMIRAYPPMKT